MLAQREMDFRRGKVREKPKTTPGREVAISSLECVSPIPRASVRKTARDSGSALETPFRLPPCKLRRVRLSRVAIDPATHPHGRTRWCAARRCGGVGCEIHERDGREWTRRGFLSLLSRRDVPGPHIMDRLINYCRELKGGRHPRRGLLHQGSSPSMPDPVEIHVERSGSPAHGESPPRLTRHSMDSGNTTLALFISPTHRHPCPLR